jgi:hypothetical protein
MYYVLEGQADSGEIIFLRKAGAIQIYELSGSLIFLSRIRYSFGLIQEPKASSVFRSFLQCIHTKYCNEFSQRIAKQRLGKHTSTERLFLCGP